MTTPTPLYTGEALLRNWSETANGKRRIVLEIEDDGGVHPFKGYEGERFAVVVVPIGNDGQPSKTNSGPGLHRFGSAQGEAAADSRPNSPDKAEGDRARDAAPSAPKPNSTRAVMMAKDEMFQRYTQSVNEADADKAIKVFCGVASKADLNKGPGAIHFDNLRRSFNSWRLSQ
jgi:hypothetical protein